MDPVIRYQNNTIIDQNAFDLSLPKTENLNTAAIGQFGTLHKHCKQDHLPRSDRCIRLGTLSEYRRAENHYVRDKDEGTFNIDLNFPDQILVESERLNAATLNTLLFGPGSISHNAISKVFSGPNSFGCVFSSANVNIRSTTDKDITLSGKIRLKSEVADAYVLCLSTAAEVGSVILDPDYDSIWSFGADALNEFIIALSGIFSAQFQADPQFSDEFVGGFNGPALGYPPRGEHMKPGTITQYWQVEYRSRTISVSNNISKEIIQEVHQRLDQSDHIKPERFSGEREFRILLRPILADTRNGNIFMFPNRLKPMLLPFGPLLEFVETTLDASG